MPVCLRDLLPKVSLWICQWSAQVRLKAALGPNLKQSALQFETVRQEMHVIWKKLHPVAISNSLKEIFPDQHEMIDRGRLEAAFEQILGSSMPKLKTSLIHEVADKFTNTTETHGLVRTMDVCEVGAFAKYAIECSYHSLVSIFKFQLDPKRKSLHSGRMLPMFETPEMEIFNPGITLTQVERDAKLKCAATKMLDLMQNVKSKQQTINKPKLHEFQAETQRKTLEIQAKLTNKNKARHRPAASLEIPKIMTDKILNTEYIERLLDVSEQHSDNRITKVKQSLTQMKTNMTLADYNKQLEQASFSTNFTPPNSAWRPSPLKTKLKHSSSFAQSVRDDASYSKSPRFYTQDQIEEPKGERYKFCSVCILF